MCHTFDTIDSKVRRDVIHLVLSIMRLAVVLNMLCVTIGTI